MKFSYRSTPLPSLAAIALTLCSVSLVGQSTFQSFDAPDAGTGIGQGTFPVGINSKGIIAGWYFDDSFVSHGFVRQAKGKITEFTPPKMSHVFIYGINDKGQVLGNGDSTIFPFSPMGFLRNPDGSYITFTVTGVTHFFATALNNKGEVAGYIFDSSSRSSSFLRDTKGNFTTFVDPNATTVSGNGTYAWAINDKGEIAGFYNYDSVSGINRGFVRSRTGSFKNFNAVPGGSTLIGALGINPSGEVAGYYGDANTLATQCYVRDATGKVTDFDIPGSIASTATAINDGGAIVGYWQLSNAITVDAFIRDANGNITTFAAPNKALGTFATGINHLGQITGNWQDSVTYVNHGFIQ